MELRSTAAKAAVEVFGNKVESLTELYRKAQFKLSETYKTEFKKHKSTLLEELKKAQDSSSKAGELDTALEIRAVADDYKQLAGTPPVVNNRFLLDTADTEKKMQKLEREVVSLRKRLKPIIELEKRLVGTRWAWKPDGSAVIEFLPNGVLKGTWSTQLGKWQANPDGSVTWYFPATKRDLAYMTFNSDFTRHSSHGLARKYERSGHKIK